MNSDPLEDVSMDAALDSGPLVPEEAGSTAADLAVADDDMGPLSVGASQEIDLGGLGEVATRATFVTFVGSSSAAFVEEPLVDAELETPPKVEESPVVGSSRDQQNAAEEISVPALEHCLSMTAGADSAPIRVWVKEPEKVEKSNALGMKTSYYTFLIRTDSSIEGFLANGMEVRRRFSEFDALHKLLHTQYRGCFIPPLPEKSLRMEGRIASGGTSHEDFMRLRRADLQAFLRALTAHPVLLQAEALKLFLLQLGDLGRNPAWLNMIEPPPANKQSAVAPTDSSAALPPASPTKAVVGSVMSWFRSSFSSASAQANKEVPPDEVSLRQAKDMLNDLEKLLHLACESARVMCTDMDKMCEDFREFGRGMGMLSRYEEALQLQVGSETEDGEGAGRRCFDLQKAAICSAKQHSIWRTNCVKSAANLVPLRDFHLLVPEAVKALEHREVALSNLDVLESELVRVRLQMEQTQAASSKAAAGQQESAASGAEKRSYALSQSISSLEEQIKVASALYTLVKERNQSELKRFGLERERDFHRMFAHFASTQASMVQSSADAWAALATQYQQPRFSEA